MFRKRSETMHIYNPPPFKLLISAALLIPALLYGFIVWQDYHTTIRNGKAEVARTAKIFEQHALSVFETHQLVAQRINDRLKEMSWDEIEHSTELSRYLMNIEKEYPQVFALWLADSSGVVRNASRPLPAQPVSVADRDYFQALRKDSADLFIGHIVKPRIMKSLNFNVAYRRGGKSGPFDGIIIVTASPDYFSKFWNSVTSQKDSVAILLRSDGAILSRSLGLEQGLLRLPDNSPPMKAIKTATEGSYIADSVHDGSKRIYGYSRIDKLNVYAFYGVSMQSVLRQWYEHCAIYGCFFGIAMVILVLFARSARKHAESMHASEEALRESEKIYRAIGESIDYGIWVCDAAGRNLYASESFLKLVGLTQEQCSDFGWGDILHPDDAEQTMALWQKCVQTEGVWDIEHRFRGVDGTWHPILARGVPVRDESGKLINWVGINLDISRIKQAEEELKKINENLDHLVAERTREVQEKNLLLLQQSRLAAMGEMIQNIAHQWRQPLNAVGLYVQSLLMYYDNGALDREYLQTVTDDSMKLIRHMSRTVDDVRNFIKQDKDKEYFKLAQVLESAIQLVQASFQNCHIQIVKNCPDDTVAYGFPNAYAQVILNILSNAKDAILARNIAKPVVTITARMEDGKSVVTISDNAGGISEEILFKVFDPHFSTKGPQGAGIGLFMAKNIIEKSMNGSLRVSNNAEGAVFTIQL